MTTSASRPARTARMTRSCPGRNSSRPKRSWSTRTRAGPDRRLKLRLRLRVKHSSDCPLEQGTCPPRRRGPIGARGPGPGPGRWIFPAPARVRCCSRRSRHTQPLIAGNSMPLKHIRFVVLALMTVPSIASAQEPAMGEMGGMPMSSPFSIGGQGILELTRVSPAHSGMSYTEGYLTEPAIMVHARPFGGHLEGTGTLDLEGLTLTRGELTPGAWGEGYVDRRHPHTYVHELMASGVVGSRWAGSVSAGKGFAPFGTDDPMVRPFVKYPVNHHLSQILERAVVVAGVRAGPALLEVG